MSAFILIQADKEVALVGVNPQNALLFASLLAQIQQKCFELAQQELDKSISHLDKINQDVLDKMDKLDKEVDKSNVEPNLLSAVHDMASQRNGRRQTSPAKSVRNVGNGSRASR